MRSIYVLVFLVFVYGCGGSSGSGSGSDISDAGTTDPGTTDPGTTDPGTTDPGAGTGSYSLDARFGSFMGGTFFERVQAVYVDNGGFIYLGGHTQSTNFPVTPNAYDTTKSPPSGAGADTQDGFVAKLTPDGARIIWATLIGGSGRDQVYALRADAGGNVYILGATGSGDFPTTPGAYDRTFNGPSISNGITDIFVASLTPDGTTLRFSTYVGGSQGGEENPRGAIELDEQGGRIYVAGETTAPDFPTTIGTFQPGYGGGAHDAFVLVLSIDGQNLIASTFIGGVGSDMAFTGIALHPSRDSVYIGGSTNSPDFPVTAGAFQGTLADGNPNQNWWESGDAYVMRIATDLDNVLFSTFLGGSGADAVSHNQGLTVDSHGRAVVIGQTKSADFPVTQAAFDTTLNGVSDGFVAVFTQQGALEHATYLGGSQNDNMAGVFVGPLDRIYMTGLTGSDDFVTTGDAYQATFGSYAGGNLSDAFLTVFDSSLQQVEYSTYLGGSGSETGRTVWGGANGRVVVGGVTDSSDFPLLPPSVQPQIGGDNDGFMMAFDPQP